MLSKKFLKMVPYAANAFITTVVLFSTVARADGTVAVDIELNPVGNFTTKSTAAKGDAIKQGSGYFAKRILLDLNSLSSDIDLRDKHMKEEYFETGKGKLNQMAAIFNAKGEGGKFTATLMIRGKKKPVEGTYEVSGSKLTAKFKTKLSEFEIKKANYMGVGVIDEVAVTAEIPIATGGIQTPVPALPLKARKAKKL